MMHHLVVMSEELILSLLQHLLMIYFLQDLNQDVNEVLNNIETLCLWTPFDIMIIPAESSVMGVGKEVNFPVLVHRWMLDDNRVLQEIIDFIST